VFFRVILAIPVWLVASILQYLLQLVAIGLWVVALILGREPEGMQSLGLFCVRFMARTHAYLMLLTPRYPAFGETPVAPLQLDQTALPPIP
jgi:hypothetical protein